MAVEKDSSRFFGRLISRDAQKLKLIPTSPSATHTKKMSQKRGTAATTLSNKSKGQKKQKKPMEPVPPPVEEPSVPRCNAPRNWPMRPCQKVLTMYERWDGMGHCLDCHPRCFYCGANERERMTKEEFAECSACYAKACPDCAKKNEWKNCGVCHDSLCTLRACVAERNQEMTKCKGGCGKNLCRDCKSGCDKDLCIDC